MKSLPEIIRTAWTERDGYAVLATVDAAGLPNAIYVGALQMRDDDAVVIADNYFHKTRANILAGSHATLLFLTKGKKSYQLKGRVDYLTTGPIFDDMKQWNPARRTIRRVRRFCVFISLWPEKVRNISRNRYVALTYRMS